MMQPVSYQRHYPPRGGFSLIELLVVIAIIAILATMATSAFSSMQRSQSLSSAAQLFAGQLYLARQTAVARNLPVEVRVYQLPDFGLSVGSPTYWRAVRIFDGSGPDAKPIFRSVSFPARIIVASDSTASPLFQSMAQSSGPVPGFGSANWPYRSLIIRPNMRVTLGGAAPPNSNYFLSLRQENAPPVADGLPSNFATLQINPFTARVVILRP